MKVHHDDKVGEHIKTDIEEYEQQKGANQRRVQDIKFKKSLANLLTTNFLSEEIERMKMMVKNFSCICNRRNLWHHIKIHHAQHGFKFGMALN